MEEQHEALQAQAAAKDAEAGALAGRLQAEVERGVQAMAAQESATKQLQEVAEALREQVAGLEAERERQQQHVMELVRGPSA